MGIELYAGKKELCVRNECYVILKWVDKFFKDERPVDERIGSYDIPVESVVACNNAVPFTAPAARNSEFWPYAYGKDFTDENFLHARDFLFYAAKGQHEIRGSS
tara:strand:- start:121 stop:432 length:312 start_codon:yes stop_codon:yes gene_type:complete